MGMNVSVISVTCTVCVLEMQHEKCIEVAELVQKSHQWAHKPAQLGKCARLRWNPLIIFSMKRIKCITLVFLTPLNEAWSPWMVLRIQGQLIERLISHIETPHWWFIPLWVLGFPAERTTLIVLGEYEHAAVYWGSGEVGRKGLGL